MEDNETKEEACIREVYEETGLHVSIIKLLGERIIPETKVKLSYFLCKQNSYEIMIQDKNEILEIAYKTKKEFDEDIETNVYEPIKKYIKKYIK